MNDVRVFAVGSSDCDRGEGEAVGAVVVAGSGGKTSAIAVPLRRSTVLVVLCAEDYYASNAAITPL